MRSIFYKCFFVFCGWVCCSSFSNHPIYVSVTEIEHNAKDKTLEISCKIFTDDFEKTLRAAYHTHVDLLNGEKDAMNKLINDYVQKHLLIAANGKPQQLHFKGYEQIEEGIYSYYEVTDIPVLKELTVTDNLLYDYQSQQISLLHVTVNGKRRSIKMINPEDSVSFLY